MATVDLTVRGAGVFGLSVAWEAVRRGARVRVVDPGGVGAGASGGVVGALAPHTPENWNEKKAFQLESLLSAEAFWVEVDDAGGGVSGYGRIGRLQPVADARALARAEARAEGARQLWRREAVWRVVLASGRRSWAPPSATGRLIEDTLSARLHPKRACESLAAAILARGGAIEAAAPDEGAVLWATGVAGLAALGIGTGVKGQAALLRFDGRDLPQIFADGLHIVPHEDGTVAIGSTTERDAGDPTGTDTALDALIERARGMCPAIADAPVITRWAAERPRATTRAPVLGAWPGREGHFVANGGFKIGFGMAPAVGRIMADLILERRDTIPASFRLNALLAGRGA